MVGIRILPGSAWPTTSETSSSGRGLDAKQVIARFEAERLVQGRLVGSLMRDLAGGIDAFRTDLGPEAARVTVVVMTEFGRRLRRTRASAPITAVDRP